MAVVLYEFGAFTLLAKYIYRKGNVWWFKRRIPDDVAKLHPGKKGWLRFSLKTKDEAVASKKAHAEARRLDALWEAHRSGEVNYGPEVYEAALAVMSAFKVQPGEWDKWQAAELEPEAFFSELDFRAGIEDGDSNEEIARKRQYEMPPVYRAAADMFFGDRKPVFLMDALKEFQQVKVQDTETKSELDRVKVVDEFIGRYGHMPIDQYTRDNANDYVRYRLEERKNKTATVRRRINSISAVFSFMAAEGKLSKSNIFNRIHIKGFGEDSEDRPPFMVEEIRILQSLCLKLDEAAHRMRGCCIR